MSKIIPNLLIYQVKNGEAWLDAHFTGEKPIYAIAPNMYRNHEKTDIY